MRVGSAHNTITLDPGVGNLNSDVLVAQTNNQTVLRGVVFVFVLENQTLPSIVIGLALATPAELNLIALEVLFVLHNFNETLRNKFYNEHWPRNKQIESQNFTAISGLLIAQNQFSLSIDVCFGNYR